MTNFEMFSAAGNRAAQGVVDAVLKLPITTSNEDLYKTLTEKMDKVAKKHGEIWDTAVREAIMSVIERETHRRLTIYW